MAGHFVVCGMGEVGYRVVTLLRRLGEPTTVVTLNCREDWRRAAERDGVGVLCGDARDSSLLESADVHDARALIVATDHDSANVEIALDARRVRGDLPIVARLFDQALAQRLEETFGFRRALSMSAVAAPHFAAAAMGENVAGSFVLGDRVWLVEKLSLDATSPLVGVTVGDVGARYGLAVLTSETGSAQKLAPGPGVILQLGDRVTMLGQAADWDALDARVDSRRRSLELLAIVRAAAQWLDPLALWRGLRGVWHHAPVPLRGAFVLLNLLIALSVLIFHAAMDLTFVDALYFIVGTVTTAGGSDVQLVSDGLKLYAALLMVLGSLTVAILYSIITDFIVTVRFEQLVGANRVAHGGHTVVVGLSNVGYRVVEQLRSSGQPVVAIDRDPPADFGQAVRAHTPVLVGDGRLPATLLKAGIARARAVVAATHDDPTNLAIGLAAKQLAPGIRTVVRLFDADFARKAQSSLGVDVAMSGSMVAGPVFVAAALYPHVRHALVLDEQLLVLVERPVGPEWAGLTPWQIQADQGYAILFRRTAGLSYTAAGTAVLAEGEEVLAATCRPLVR